MEATSENGSRPAAELQDPDALSERQESEYDDTFVHTCEELDPFDENFEEDAQKLIDQFDEAVNSLVFHEYSCSIFCFSMNIFNIFNTEPCGVAEECCRPLDGDGGV